MKLPTRHAHDKWYESVAGCTFYQVLKATTPPDARFTCFSHFLKPVVALDP